MTTKCKHCGEEINPDGKFWRHLDESLYCYAGAEINAWLKAEPSTEGTSYYPGPVESAVERAIDLSAPPSTEGTQPVCRLCGSSPICEDGRCFSCRLEERTQADVIVAAESSVPQAAQPEREATREMIDLFTGETMGHIHHQAPAPVAQVDAGKPISTACKFGMCGDCDPNFPCDHECHGIEPAVAQTELPPIPDDLKELQRIASIPPDSGDEPLTAMMAATILTLIERIASLTQRLQEQEALLEEMIRRKNHYNEAYCEIDDKLTALQAQLQTVLDREAELKAELSLWRSEHDPCPFQLRMEALERSHANILRIAVDAGEANFNPKWTTNYKQGYREACDVIQTALRAAAEKL